VREFAPHLDAEAEASRIESAEAMELNTVTVIPGALSVVCVAPARTLGRGHFRTRPMAITRLRDAGFPTPMCWSPPMT